MSETPDNEQKQQPDDARDQIIVRHPDNQTDKIDAPEYDEPAVRIGRELDNDIVLTDPRASRHHVEVRRGADGQLEFKDLDSANGVFLGTSRIKAGIWEKLTAGQVARLGETRLSWEKAASTDTTVVMKPVQPQPAATSPAPPQPEPAAASAAPPPPTAASAAQAQPAAQPSLEPSRFTLMVGIGVAAVLLLVIGIALFFILGDGGAATPQGAETAQVAAGEGTPAARSTGASLALQTPGSIATNTPTPSGPQLPIPVIEIVSSEVRPIILGALPSTDKALYLVNLRVQNVGNASFNVSTSDFSLKTGTGDILLEAGGTTSPEGLRRLGVKDRFDDLNLTPGGSVAESLIFELEPEIYRLELIFDSPDTEPLILGLGSVNAGRDLALALGTPVAEETPLAVAQTSPTPEPTPTATRPPAIPAPQVVPRSALVGTIAYPVFNGDDYDIYLGSVDGSGTSFYRGNASQPAFNADGTRIAFHSWSGESRGLVTMDVTGANANLIANFVEDQLPTWTADSQAIIFLTRRSGGRQSELMQTDASTELGQAIVLGEGEYPTTNGNGQIVFKGWGNTAFGLRVASETLDNVQTVTNVDEDTAPAISPNGDKVVFMSRREENWNVYVANPDGTGLLRLTDDEADDGLPTWSPDGNAIAFVSNRGGPWAVWAMTSDGDGKRQLFTMEGSPDGTVGTDTFASRGWAEERISWTKANLIN